MVLLAACGPGVTPSGSSTPESSPPVEPAWVEPDATASLGADQGPGYTRVGLVATPPASADDPESVEAALRVFAEANRGRALRIRVHEPDSAEGLRATCPTRAVCDTNAHYRAFTFRRHDLSLYLSFSPALVGHMNDPAAVEAAFMYVNYEIYFEGVAPAGWEVEDAERGLVVVRQGEPDITFRRSTPGHVSGVITRTITEVRARSLAAPCRALHLDTLDGCWITAPTSIALEIDFDIAMEDIAVAASANRAGVSASSRNDTPIPEGP
jgi:hypothetical protein